MCNQILNCNFEQMSEIGKKKTTTTTTLKISICKIYKGMQSEMVS